MAKKGSNSSTRKPRIIQQPNDPNFFLRNDIQGNFNDRSYDGSGYGANPAVEQNQTYIAYFEGVGGTGPEIIDQTAYFIKYLIDTEGNIANPEPGNTGLINLLDNFEPGKNAIVNASSTTQGNIIGGPFLITGVGRISPILITETGSSIGAYTPTMSFARTPAVTGVTGTPDYEFKAALSSTQVISSPSPTRIRLASVINSNAQYDPTNPNYDFTFATDTSTYNNRVNFILTGVIEVNWLSSLLGGNQYLVDKAEIYVRIWKNGTEILNQTIKTLTPNSGLREKSFYIETGFQEFESGDYIYFDTDLTYGINFSSYSLTTDTYAQSIQEFPAKIEATASYWSVGSWLTGSNTTILTASNQLASFYSPFYIQSASQVIYDFNFNKINLPFQIQSGDYIRFEYNTNKVYNITDVNNDGGKLYLTVVPPIPTGSQLNHFVLYRIVNDGTYVILDVPKLTPGNSFSGIIQPEYISQELKDKYSGIIQKLTLEGVIT